MNFSTLELLKLLPIVGATVAQTTEFATRFAELLEDKSPEDQLELREALEDIRADNDAGHIRLQEKLRRAAER